MPHKTNGKTPQAGTPLAKSRIEKSVCPTDSGGRNHACPSGSGMVGYQATHSDNVTGKKPEEVEMEERALLLEHEKRAKILRTPLKTQTSITDVMDILPSAPIDHNLSP